MQPSGQATSALFWRVTLVAMLIDIPFLILITRRVSNELFRQLKWNLVGAAGLVYAALWGTFGSNLYWEAVYRAIFPGWFRWLLPVIYGLLFGLLALVFWRLSRLASRWQVLWFILCGGLFSLVGHSIGISRGLMQVPLLAQVSPISALAFGVFEFIFYWCMIVCLGVAGRWLVLQWERRHG